MRRPVAAFVGLAVGSLFLSACGSSSEPLNPDAQFVYDELVTVGSMEPYFYSCANVKREGITEIATNIQDYSEMDVISRSDIVAAVERYVEDCDAGVVNN